MLLSINLQKRTPPRPAFHDRSIAQSAPHGPLDSMYERIDEHLTDL